MDPTLDKLGGQARILIPVLATWLASKQIVFDSNTWNIILVALTSMVCGIWSWWRKREAANNGDVAAGANTMVVQLPPVAPAAIAGTNMTITEAQDRQKIIVANKIAALPDDLKVISNDAVAKATPSAKVVTIAAA